MALLRACVAEDERARPLFEHVVACLEELRGELASGCFTDMGGTVRVCFFLLSFAGTQMSG